MSFQIISFVGTYYCYTEYDRLASTDTSDIGFDFVTNLDSFSDKKETWLVLGRLTNTHFAYAGQSKMNFVSDRVSVHMKPNLSEM